MEAERGSQSASATTIRTFLIADVRGYTLFTAERGDEAAAKLAARFAAVAREGVEARGGAVIELRGDEALAVFDSARQAIRAAVELQGRFVDETVADPALPLAVGIGLDAGEAVPVEGGYRGGALNLAARLCGLAGPAEILASREVVHLARKVDGVTYVDRGSVHLRGLTEPVHVIRLRAEAEDAADDTAFRRALGSSAARITPVVPGVMVPNPYKGLRPFEEGDAPDFFGREALTDQLVDRLGQTRFLAVVGPSGSGKSSVVRAGLIPTLRRGGLPGSSDWTIVEMLPGAHPLDELEAALLRVAVNPPSSLIEQLERDDHGLLRAAKRVLPADTSELVLLIDQFEEVFTLVEDEAMRTHFLESLEAAVADPHSRLRVVITLRADFYDRPLLYRGFAELLRSRVEAVVPLSPEELERAISEPAKRVDVRLEHGLVVQMLADVAQEPGGLPLLEYALTEQFERREDSILTLEAYRAIGGVSGALGRRAEELYGDLDAGGKEATRQLFLRLVALGEGTEDTRRPVTRSEIVSLEVDQQAMAAAIDAFGASRLLSFDRDSRTGAPTVEVAHEALLTAWGRLRRWIDEAREDLRTERRLALATHEWLDSDRDSSFLVSGSRLDQFETWRQSAGISITPEERDFLEASLAERDRRRTEDEARQARERALERRSITRLRALVAVFAAASLIASGVIVFALDQRERAERGERVAVVRELAAAAVENVDIDPERALLLALEAVDTTYRVDGTVLREAEEALHRALQADRLLLTVPGNAEVDFSPDGTRLLTGGEEGVIHVYGTQTGKPFITVRDPSKSDQDLDFSPDGHLFASSSGTLWDAATGQQIRRLHPVGGEAVFTVSFSPNGQFVAAASLEDFAMHVMDAATGEQVNQLDGIGLGWTAFSPDGEHVLITDESGPDPWVAGHVANWHQPGGGPNVLTLFGHIGGGINDAAWSLDGSMLTTTARDRAIIWDARTGRQKFTLSAAADFTDADFSPDSKLLATGMSDGSAIVWELSSDGAKQILSVAGHEGEVRDVVFSPDGDRLATGSYDGTAKVWDVTPGGDREWLALPGLVGIDYSPDGRLLATGSASGEVHLFDATSGREVSVLRGHKWIAALDFSPTGDRLASADPDDGTARIWDVASGARLLRLSEHIPPDPEDDFADARFSPDGSRVATATLFGHLRIWDAETGERLLTLRDRSGEPVEGRNSIDFSADGTLMAAGVEDVAFVWRVDTGEIVATLQQPAGVINRVAFSPRRAHLVTAGDDGSLTLWDTRTWETIGSTTANLGQVYGLAFAPAGDRFATLSTDGTVRLWDVQPLEEALLIATAHQSTYGPLDLLAFSPDGTRLAAMGDDGARVYALVLDDLVELARDRATRGFTEEECHQYLHEAACPTAGSRPE